MIRLVALSIALAASWQGSGLAAEPVAPAQVEALRTCKSVLDDNERLACYDRAVNEFIRSADAREVVVINREQATKTRQGLFGFSVPPITFLSSDDEPGARERDNRLVTTVTSAKRLGRSFWQFTVEDGAVWQTVEDIRTAIDPKPGATVVIERGTLGAYHVKVGKGGRVLARRVR